jgi:hypothetical protein
MKKLILIFLIGCTPTVTVNTANNFVRVGIVQTSIVAGFQHQYDSCHLVITNQANNIQYIFDAKSPAFNNIPLSKGDYNIFMDTPEAPAISYYMAFVGYINKSITSGANTVTIPIESKQALILVEKSTVDAVPSVTVNGVTGIMSIAPSHYYAYVKGNAVVSYKVGGKDAQMPIATVAQKIYLLSASLGNINVNDPFIQVITI